MWNKYRKQFAYAKDITFEMVMESLIVLCSCMIQDSCLEPTTV